MGVFKLQSMAVVVSTCTGAKSIISGVYFMYSRMVGVGMNKGSSLYKHASKKKRGKTRLTKLFAGPSKNVRINRRNQLVGTEATDLTNFLGTSVHAPIQYKDWRDMPVEYKKALLEMTKDKFNLSDDQYGWVLNSLNLKWKEHKCDLKRKLFKVYDNDAEMIANKDPDVLHDQLAILIEHWRSEKAQEQLQEWMSKVPNASEDVNVRNDIFSEVLGLEPRGLVRGLGLSASKSV